MEEMPSVGSVERVEEGVGCCAEVTACGTLVALPRSLSAFDPAVWLHSNSC